MAYANETSLDPKTDEADKLEQLLLRMAEAGYTVDGKRLEPVGEHPVTHRQLFLIVEAPESPEGGVQ